MTSKDVWNPKGSQPAEVAGRVAQQMTLRDTMLFLAVGKDELRSCAWAFVAAPTIMELLDRRRRIVLWVVGEILTQYKAAGLPPADLVTNMVRTAHALYRLGNYFSCEAVIRGLRHPLLAPTLESHVWPGEGAHVHILDQLEGLLGPDVVPISTFGDDDASGGGSGGANGGSGGGGNGGGGSGSGGNGASGIHSSNGGGGMGLSPTPSKQVAVFGAPDYVQEVEWMMQARKPIVPLLTHHLTTMSRVEAAAKEQEVDTLLRAQKAHGSATTQPVEPWYTYVCSLAAAKESVLASRVKKFASACKAAHRKSFRRRKPIRPPSHTNSSEDLNEVASSLDRFTSLTGSLGGAGNGSILRDVALLRSLHGGLDDDGTSPRKDSGGPDVSETESVSPSSSCSVTPPPTSPKVQSLQQSPSPSPLGMSPNRRHHLLAGDRARSSSAAPPVSPALSSQVSKLIQSSSTHHRRTNSVSGLCVNDEWKLSSTPAGQRIAQWAATVDARDSTPPKYTLDLATFDYVCDYLEAYPRLMQESGLYRKSGEARTTNVLWASFCLGKPKFMENRANSVHCVTGAFKKYLRQSIEPLIPFDAYDDFVSTLRNQSPDGGDSDAAVTALKAAVQTQLSPTANACLHRLCGHLRQVASHAEHNKMNVHNLSIVFGPTLMRPRVETLDTMMDNDVTVQVVEALVENMDVVFDPPVDPATLPYTQLPLPEWALNARPASPSIAELSSSPKHAPSPKKKGRRTPGKAKSDSPTSFSSSPFKRSSLWTTSNDGRGKEWTKRTERRALTAMAKNAFVLVLGNRNYSCWSMAAWLFATRSQLVFRERLVQLYTPDAKEKLALVSPSGKVPVLLMNERAVAWDTLAIMELLCELAPDAEAVAWPRDPELRALARSVTTEMCTGFPEMRQHMPFNARKMFKEVPIPGAVETEVKRLREIYTACRATIVGIPPSHWLFGAFCPADAVFLTYALRMLTYGVDVGKGISRYISASAEEEDVNAWMTAAAAETAEIKRFEWTPGKQFAPSHVPESSTDDAAQQEDAPRSEADLARDGFIF